MRSDSDLLTPPVEETDSSVAIYARTSSKSQQFGYSLDEQVRQCLRHAELRGWKIRFLYRDEAESGKDTDRPMFQLMMDSARNQLFDVIMFWKLDRFSRSLMHAVQLEADLRSFDVGLFSVTEQIDTTTAAGRFNFRNIASAAEFERDMIQQRTQMGLHALAMEHKWPNDQPPLGYTKRSDGTLKVDSEDADLVRSIFDSYLDEKSMPVVADQLNQRSISTNRGGDWCPRAIGDCLQNELYIGWYSVGDVREHVPEYQIVSSETFEEVDTVRTRFRTSGVHRRSMDTSRKGKLASAVVRSYSEYLDKREP